MYATYHLKGSLVILNETYICVLFLVCLVHNNFVNSCTFTSIHTYLNLFSVVDTRGTHTFLQYGGHFWTTYS